MSLTDEAEKRQSEIESYADQALRISGDFINTGTLPAGSRLTLYFDKNGEPRPERGDQREERREAPEPTGE